MSVWARNLPLGIAVAAASVLVAGCESKDEPANGISEEAVALQAAGDQIGRWSEALGLEPAAMRRIARASPLPPLTSDPTNVVADDLDAAALGETLFFDPRLSGPGDVSCATCHAPDQWFTDGLARSRGIGETLRNAPTLVDATHQRWFNWDGRSDSMWSHAIRPIEHPNEMGGDRTALARYVLGDPELRRRFEAIFGSIDLEAEDLPRRARPNGNEAERAAWASMSESKRRSVDSIAADVGKVLAAYQRTLVGGPSRFDDWVEALRTTGTPPEGVLDDQELAGMAIFFGRGECWECHAGPHFSDGEFHNIGLPVAGGLPRDPGRYDGAALVVEDRFNAAGVHSDDRSGARAIISRGVRQDPGSWGAFRTPSLRHVAETPPYMHDGSMIDLHEVVRFYSELEGAIQLDHHQESVLSPLGLSDEEVDELVAFLRTLTGVGADKQPPEND